jgi:hypothetical protein
MVKTLLAKLLLSALFRARSIAGWVRKPFKTWYRRQVVNCRLLVMAEHSRLQDEETKDKLFAEHQEALRKRYFDLRYGARPVLSPETLATIREICWEPEARSTSR